MALTDTGLKDVTATTPPVHVGLGGDGCSTNRREKGGVKAILKKEYPWFLFAWCIAHRLQLALKNAFSGTYFKEIDDCLLKGYLKKWKSGKLFIFSCFFVDLLDKEHVFQLHTRKQKLML